MGEVATDTSSDNTTSAAPAPFVLYDVVDGCMEIQLHTATSVGAAMGERLLASFYKCFVGVERVLSYEHLLLLNYQGEQEHKHHRKPAAGPRLDAYAFSRNRRTLVLLIQGILYELGAALQEMCALKVIEKLGDRSVWEPINKARAGWNTDKYAKTWRNEFAHHLGELDDYVRGLHDPLTSGVVTLHAARSKYRHGGAFQAPLDTLLRGHDVKDDKVTAFAEKTRDTNRDLPDQFLALFYEVLRTTGVELRITDAAKRWTTG
ncbi:hypothetical protein BH11MYX3_BH11MYX3_04710 [soil metagenome]